MTVIEFFDRESAVENITSALLCSPEKVIFIGANSKRMKKCAENYKQVITERGLTVDFFFRAVSRNNLTEIVSTLEEIILKNSDCIIDLSGGDELYLVAAGMIYEKHGNKVRLHRFNIGNNRMTDYDSDGNVCQSAPMKLSVDENIMVYGGRVIYEEEKQNSTKRWNFDSEFINDVHLMWNICKKDTRQWNAQTNTIARLCTEHLDKSTLKFSANIRKFDGNISALKRILTELEKEGLIRSLRIDERISFSFKSSQVMCCLTTAGRVLELIIAVTAMEIKENDKEVYSSVLNGVYIDWDGVLHSDSRADVENEMDIILMKGMVPVFISCKNGAVDANELYKLSVVSERFGGKYVKKVLVTTQLDEMGYRAEYIRARSADMGINLIEDVDTMTDAELQKKILRFC